MGSDVSLVVEAINGLKTESSIYKDYFFPVMSSFFSAVLGAWVAYFALKFQDRNLVEREKLVSCNDWTITMEGGFQSLISIKDSYSSELGDNPIQRALTVRSILGDSKKIEKNIATLSFIVPKRSDQESVDEKWRSLSRIGALVSNYNLVFSIWKKRNDFERPLREKLMSAVGDKGYAEITHDQVVKILGEKDLVSLIDLTERAVILTDDLIIETNDFLVKFPLVAKSIIDTSRTKGFGTLIEFVNEENPFLKKLLVKCPKPNYGFVEELYGLSKEQLEQLYQSAYQDYTQTESYY